MPYTKMEATSQLAEYEEVSFSYGNISWRYKGADGEQKSTPVAAKEFMASEEEAVVKYFGDKFKELAKDIGTAVAAAVKGGAGGAPPAAPGGN